MKKCKHLVQVKALAVIMKVLNNYKVIHKSEWYRAVLRL